MSNGEFPCPCGACDSVSIIENEYCAKCMHHGCKGKKAKCPDAKHSHDWCDYCNLKKETVKAPPESEKNRICGDCHQSGSLPEKEEWWDERQPETDAKCPRCDSDFGMVSTVSCTDCGYIPEKHQA